MLVLALESSTSSAKALLFDTEKGVLETADASYASEGLIRSQGVTDTDGVFRLTAHLGRRLAQGRDIAAIALCGTFHSMAVCESDMSARDTYSWNYMAPSLQCAEARKDEALVEKLYTRTGCYPHVTYMRHTLRYLADSGMKLTGKKLISQGAYNLFQLTGEYAESVSTASGWTRAARENRAGRGLGSPSCVTSSWNSAARSSCKASSTAVPL